VGCIDVDLGVVEALLKRRRAWASQAC